jgi:hypothetical protein
MTTIPTSDDLATLFAEAFADYNDNSARSQQTQIGASEIGFCRQRTAYRVKEQEPTDRRSMWAASVGTAIHAWAAEALKASFPEWIIEDVAVTATLPSGNTILGHPDIIIPSWNACLDIKTVDGFAKIKRFGTSPNHKYQRHLYTLGALQAGLLDATLPVYVGNVYLDRSGKEPIPYVVVEEMDPLLTDEIDAWVGDVIYAVAHGEDAMRDVAAPTCEAISCEFFTACRGGLPAEENEVIDSPEVREAVTLFIEARDMKREADRMANSAKATLTGLNGVVGGYQVRTTVIPESQIAASVRNSYTRLDVVKVRD